MTSGSPDHEEPAPGVLLHVGTPDRGVLDPAELRRLFDRAWPGHGDPGWERVLGHALGWVTARDAASQELVGFVNVATDGGEHAFLLDTVVLPDLRRRGIGRALVRAAADLGRDRGAAWIHVDFTADLTPFYAACGFRPSAAGLLRLDTP